MAIENSAGREVKEIFASPLKRGIVTNITFFGAAGEVTGSAYPYQNTVSCFEMAGHLSEHRDYRGFN